MSEEMIREGRPNVIFRGISCSLRKRGRRSQRLLCALMMTILTAARLPGGDFCCVAAMFAALLRQGCLVPSAFAGVLAGFVLAYGAGQYVACWQLTVCTLLWLTCGLWARRESRMGMAGAVFIVQLTNAALIDPTSPYQMAVMLLTAAVGAGLSVLFDGAVLVVCRKDELDGDTRPLCILAVCAALAAGSLRLPYGHMIASAFCCYLVLEHAYIGGGAQALLCAGVLGSVISLSVRSPQAVVMLMCGGFVAGEIRSSRRWIAALLMAMGMLATAMLLGGGVLETQRYLFMMPGLVPFLVLPSAVRASVTSLVERAEPEDLTQSEAVAVRCASMIHAWAGLYEDTARMMEGLSALQDGNALTGECVQLLRKTSAASRQVCERTLSQIHPDDAAFRRIRYALVRAGMEEARPAYALSIGGRLEVMLTKPSDVAPVSLEGLLSRACGVSMRACAREGLLSTQALYEQAPELALEIGAACRSRSGEEVTGDSYISRALPGGRHVLALSDGMGSGLSARQESHAALLLLSESLHAGYTRAQALDVVNALMLMCTGREMYATMDMCVCDLHSGEAAFEKLGACASYVVRDGEVRSLGADTLPVGVLPDVEARSLRLTLQAGDCVVMMTDGVADAYPGGEEALRAEIGRLYWLHPQAVGEKLIARAAGEGEPKDDMTVLCARVRRSAIE